MISSSSSKGEPGGDSMSSAFVIETDFLSQAGELEAQG
jgi:hypothetical protein